MSKAVLEEMLRKSEASINQDNTPKAKAVATQVANKTNVVKAISKAIDPSYAVNVGIKIDAAKVDAKAVLASIGQVTSRSTFGKFNKLAASKLNQTKAEIIANISKLKGSEAYRSETIDMAITVVGSCKTISDLAGLPFDRTKRISSNGSLVTLDSLKRVYNIAVVEPFLTLLISALESYKTSVGEAIYKLAGASDVNFSKDENKAIQKAISLLERGNSIVDKEIPSISGQLIDSVKDLTDTLKKVEQQVVNSFHISDEDARDVLKFGSHIIDVGRLTSNIKIDSDLVRDSVSKTAATSSKASKLSSAFASKDSRDKFGNYIQKVSKVLLDKLVTKHSGNIVCGELQEGVYAFTNIKAAKYTDSVKSVYSYNTTNSSSTFLKSPKDFSESDLDLNFNIFDSIAAEYTRQLNDHVLSAISGAKTQKDGTSILERTLSALSKDDLTLPSSIVSALSYATVQGKLFDPGHINSVKLSEVSAHPVRRALRFAQENPNMSQSVLDVFDLMNKEMKRLSDSGGAGLTSLLETRMKSGLSKGIYKKLSEELVTGELELNRVLTSDEARAHLIAKFKVVSERSDSSNEPEFLDLLEIIQSHCFVATGVQPEISVLNRYFGPTVQGRLLEAKNVFMEYLLEQIENEIKELEKKLKKEKVVDIANHPSILKLKGSPSLLDMLTAQLVNLLQFGKPLGTQKHTTKVFSKKKSKKVVVEVTANLSINKISVKSSPLITKKPPTKSPRKITSVKAKKASVKETTTVRKTQSRPLRLRNTQGHFTSLTHIRNLLELNLFDTIKKNMTAPRLVFRSGRFASSAQIKSITHGADDVVDIRYTYMKNPYQTFEPGFKQGSLARDPKTLITGSIREVLKDKVLQRLRVTRV